MYQILCRLHDFRLRDQQLFPEHPETCKTSGHCEKFPQEEKHPVSHSPYQRGPHESEDSQQVQTPTAKLNGQCQESTEVIDFRLQQKPPYLSVIYPPSSKMNNPTPPPSLQLTSRKLSSD